MDSKKPIGVGISSALIELKAELQRKQNELKSSSLSSRGVSKSLKVKNETKAQRLASGSNRGIDKRIEKDKIEKIEEDKSIERAKYVLEQKAKLYDKMNSANSLSLDESHPVLTNSLVDFQRKVIEEEEWTEFTDALGRTRKCLKTDLSHFIKEDDELKKRLAPKISAGVEEEISIEEKVRLEKREKWEAEVSLLADKSKVHYQDILFDEIRAHGAGYYEFSKDDDERAFQLAQLNKLSEETQATRSKILKQKSNKKRQMKERLRKVENRKRSKLGLPPLEDPLSTSSDEETTEKYEIPDSNPYNKKSETDEVRAWDYGKPGIFTHKLPESFDELDKKWLDTRREERKNEFAPPSFYSDVPTSSSKLKYSNFVQETKKYYEPISSGAKTTPQPIKNEVKSSQDKSNSEKTNEVEATVNRKRAEIAPPLTFDYYHGENLGTKEKKVENRSDFKVAEVIAQGVESIRRKVEEKLKKKTSESDF